MKREGNEGFLLLAALAPRDRRAIGLGLVVILPALGYMLGVKPFRTALEEAEDRVSAERELLSRELGLLESRETLLESLRQMEGEAVEAERGVLRAPSSVLAEERLTEILENSAYRNQVFLQEIRTGELGRGEDPPPALTVIRLHLRGESDLQGVLSFLSEVERSGLLLRVRGLALEPEVARPGPGGDGGRGEDAVPTGVVTFQLIVDGYTRSDGDLDFQASDPSGPVD